MRSPQGGPDVSPPRCPNFLTWCLSPAHPSFGQLSSKLPPPPAPDLGGGRGLVATPCGDDLPHERGQPRGHAGAAKVVHRGERPRRVEVGEEVGQLRVLRHALEGLDRADHVRIEEAVRLVGSLAARGGRAWVRQPHAPGAARGEVSLGPGSGPVVLGPRGPKRGRPKAVTVRELAVISRIAREPKAYVRVQVCPKAGGPRPGASLLGSLRCPVNHRFTRCVWWNRE
mmetsp:Transcript_29425/g.65908  ORF Transcript_29425/g.65908 Transcript_29425/m.65908 type:complete len:227 (-) Transcript_29425:207-887(-)